MSDGSAPTVEKVPASTMERDLDALFDQASKLAKGARDRHLGIAGAFAYVKERWPDAPVSDDHLVPDGYTLLDEAPHTYAITRRTRGHVANVAHAPVVVTGWVKNRSTGDCLLEVSWRSQGVWRKLTMERARLLDSGKIVGAISNTGFPVDSGNKAQMVSYLSAYDTLNRAKLPVTHFSEQMGWQRDGGFIAGRVGIETDTIYYSQSPGESQLAAAYRELGTFDDWRKAVAIAAKYPRVEIGLYASLASPLLKILEAPSFGLEWAYRTSTGKTTALRIAASVWGSPDEREANSLIQSWGGTDVGFERIASARNHLPIMLDDTKRARFRAGQSMVPKIIYSLTGGGGDIRGSKSGMAETRYWQTVLLSTGEQRSVDFSRDGGLATRIMCLWGSPFGAVTADVGDDIRALNAGLFAHHGHAGPMFVRWLLANKAEHARWREQHRELSIGYSDRASLVAGDPGVGARVGTYLATLEMAERLAHRALDLPWKSRSVANMLLAELVDSTAEYDRAAQALLHVYNWSVSNRDKFWTAGDGDTTKNEPSGGWLGRWDNVASKWIGFDRRQLERELKSAGYDVSAVLRLWADSGYLVCDAGRQTMLTRVANERVRVVAVSLASIERFC